MDKTILGKAIQKLRVEYGSAPLLEEEIADHPLSQFQKWLQEAIAAKVFEPNAMTLATVSDLGRPSSRAVLLKSFDNRGLIFFSHYESRKARHLLAHPYGSVTFWWKEIYRQVNLEGRIEKIAGKENSLYFKSRPKGAQIAACASEQSQPLSSREELEERYRRIQKEYRGKEIPCPKNWGGYRLIPDRIEFWQGRKNRLHDRFLFVLVDKKWVRSRLNP